MKLSKVSYILKVTSLYFQFVFGLILAIIIRNDRSIFSLYRGGLKYLYLRRSFLRESYKRYGKCL